MAGNALTDGLGFAAAQALGKSSGTDFFGPMMQGAQQKDLFMFQQREAVRQREESRKKFTEERRASRRGLLGALQATGSVLPEDLTAAGGVDSLADLDDSEFEILTARLTDKQMQRLGDAELEASLRGILPAMGLPPLGPGPHSRSELLTLKANADMTRLMKQEGKERQDEAARALATTVKQAGRDIGAMFERPQAVTIDAMRQAFGRHTQAAARLATAGGDLSDDDYRALEDELSSMADEIRRQQIHVGLNELAKGSPGEIIAGLTQLDPDQRSLALERPSISSAWQRVTFAANELVGLGEDGATRLGLGELYKQALEGDPAQDGALAQSLSAAVGKISEGQRTLKRLEANDAGLAEATRTVSEVAALGFAASGLEPSNYVNQKTGDFDRPQFLRDAYSEQLVRVDQMDPVAAQDFLTTLAAVGAPADMQRLAAKGAQAGFARAIGETRPNDLLDLSTQTEQIGRQEDVAHAALGEMLTAPLGTTSVPPTSGARFAPTLNSRFHHTHVGKTRVAPEYLAKLRGAVEATGQPLVEQRAAVDAWGQNLVDKIAEARRSGDEGLATAYTSAAEEHRQMSTALQARLEVRGQLTAMLKGAAPILGEFKNGAGGTDDQTKASVLQSFGMEAEKAAEAAPALTDTGSVLAAMRDQALAGLKNRTTEQGAAEAVAAEIDRIYELSMRLDAQLQDPETLKLYRQAGIIKGEAGDMPALELLAYLL